MRSGPHRTLTSTTPSPGSRTTSHGPDNLGPLSRTVHGAKTHGGWLLRQLTPGMFFWRSPDGFAYLVTPSRSWMIHNPVTPRVP